MRVLFGVLFIILAGIKILLSVSFFCIGMVVFVRLVKKIYALSFAVGLRLVAIYHNA